MRMVPLIRVTIGGLHWHYEWLRSGIGWRWFRVFYLEEFYVKEWREQHEKEDR